MIEFLEFTFRSFWHFLGVLMLLGTASSFLRGFIIINKNYNITTNDKDED